MTGTPSKSFVFNKIHSTCLASDTVSLCSWLCGYDFDFNKKRFTCHWRLDTGPCAFIYGVNPFVPNFIHWFKMFRDIFDPCSVNKKFYVHQTLEEMGDQVQKSSENQMNVQIWELRMYSLFVPASSKRRSTFARVSFVCCVISVSCAVAIFYSRSRCIIDSRLKNKLVSKWTKEKQENATYTNLSRNIHDAIML